MGDVLSFLESAVTQGIIYSLVAIGSVYLLPNFGYC